MDCGLYTWFKTRVLYVNQLDAVYNKYIIYVSSSHATVDLILMAVDQKLELWKEPVCNDLTTRFRGIEYARYEQ